MNKIPIKKLNLAIITSLRNSAVDHYGEIIPYKGNAVYMKSPLEFLVEKMYTSLGAFLNLVGVINDDIADYDKKMLRKYPNKFTTNKPWFFNPYLTTPDGKKVIDLMHCIPSTFRTFPLSDIAKRKNEKEKFEYKIEKKLKDLRVDIVLLEGLLVILKDLVNPKAYFYKKILNIHPGITRIHYPYTRRGLHASRDALKGIKQIPSVKLTGASLHFVNSEIDAGLVIYEKLNTKINLSDTLEELKWRNFQKSLLDTLEQGLLFYVKFIYQNLDKIKTLSNDTQAAPLFENFLDK